MLDPEDRQELDDMSLGRCSECGRRSLLRICLACRRELDAQADQKSTEDARDAEPLGGDPYLPMDGDFF